MTTFTKEQMAAFVEVATSGISFTGCFIDEASSAGVEKLFAKDKLRHRINEVADQVAKLVDDLDEYDDEHGNEDPDDAQMAAANQHFVEGFSALRRALLDTDTRNSY